MAAARVVVHLEHDLARVVGEDQVLVAVGQHLQRLVLPGVVALGRAGGHPVEVVERAQAARGGRAARPLGDLLGHPLQAVVLVVVVGVRRHLAVRGRGRAAHRGHQPSVGRGAEDVLQPVQVAVGLAVGVVAVVVGVQGGAVGVQDVRLLQVADAAVGGNVAAADAVVGVVDLADGAPVGAVVRGAPQYHVLYQQVRVVLVLVRLDEGAAVERGRAPDLGQLAVRRQGAGQVAIGVGIALEAAAQVD